MKRKKVAKALRRAYGGPNLPPATFTVRMNGTVEEWGVCDGDILYFDPIRPLSDGDLCFVMLTELDSLGTMRFQAGRFIDGRGHTFLPAVVQCRGVHVGTFQPVRSATVPNDKGKEVNRPNRQGKLLGTA